MIHALLPRILVLPALVLAVPAAYAQTLPVGSWTTRADAPVEIDMCGTATDGTSIFCFGGNIYGDGGQGTGAYRYDPATDSYARLADLPMQTIYNCGSYHAGAVYSFGATYLPYPPGYGTGYVPDAILRYSIASNTWTLLSERVTRHGIWSSTAKVGSRIFIIGGSDNYVAGFVPGAVSEFDPTTETLTPKADLPLPSSWHASAGCDANGKVYVFGAWDPGSDPGDSDDTARRTFEYDPTLDAWTERAPLTSGGNPVDRYLPAAIAIGNRLYVTGGVWTSTTADCIEYDPALNAWRDVADMSLARYWHSAAAVGGKGYVIGGFTDPGQPSSAVSSEEFSPPDFGTAPSAAVEQRMGTQAVPQGGAVYGIVRFAAQVDDSDAGQLVRFQVEVKLASAPDWTGAVSMDTGFVPAGLLTHDWYVPTLSGYDWRWRVMDAYGNLAAGTSGWTDFGDPAVSPDFVRTNPPPPPPGDDDSGGGKCGGSAGGGTGFAGAMAALVLVAGAIRR